MRFVTLQDEPKPLRSDVKADNTAFSNGPEVLALGLPRCATSSTQAAFEEYLSLSPSLHFAYILPHLPRMRVFNKVVELSPYLYPERNNTEAVKQQRQAHLHSLYQGFRSACDVPTPLCAEDVIEMYPDAKLVLNLRPGRTTEEATRAWHKSFQEAIAYQRSWWFGAITFLWPNDRLLHKMHGYMKPMLLNQSNGAVTDGWDDVKSYEWHNENMRRLAKKHNRPLLEWDPTQGWQPLCDFLGKDVPKDANGNVIPFPKINDMKTMRILKAIFLARGAMMWVLLGGAVWLPFWLVKRFT